MTRDSILLRHDLVEINSHNHVDESREIEKSNAHPGLFINASESRYASSIAALSRSNVKDSTQLRAITL